jgi:nicotinate-nucleotide adenylyltransferase
VAYLKAGYTNLGQIPAKNFRILINGETAWGSLWTHYVPAAGRELEAFPHAPEAPVGGDVRPATLQVPGRLTSFDLGSRNTVGQLLKNFERAGKPKVGVFFGTFDPIHEGHMRVIRQAMQAAGLDEVVIVPNFTAGHKPGATSVARRIAMLAARVAGESHMNVYTGDSSLLVDRFTRAPLMERIKQIYGTDNLVQVVGQDSFEKSVADHLIDPAAHRWLVFPRVVGHPISIPEELKPIVDVAPFPDDTALSSTAIREAFATGHIPAADRVHPAVTRYILATGLYRPH